MTIFKEYPEYDAIGLAELMQAKEISSKEVVDTALYLIEKINPKLNAFVNVLHKEIDVFLKEVNSSKALYSGVPMAIKECVAGIQGIEQKYGSRISKNNIAEQDEEVISRYRSGGFVFVGQTNAPEFSSTITTEPVLYGRCSNPWDLDLTVGGSSGGSACAVAAGLVPVASANDTVGSIRIPASCNGIFGFKPSRGRVPNGPRYSEIWHGLFVQHALTRSVRDSAALLDLTHGLDVGAPYTAPAFESSFLQQVECEPKKLKIAFTHQAPNNVKVDESCQIAVSELALLLQSMGHEVVETKPEYDGVELFELLTDLIAVNLAYEVTTYANMIQQPINSETIEACHIKLIEKGKSTNVFRLMHFLEVKASLERYMGRFFCDYDLLLTPTLATLPVKHGYITPSASDFDEYLKRFWQFSPFVSLANICGLPSMNIPTHWTAKKIPVGTLITAKYGDEATLFRLAGQLEKANPWVHRHPPVSAWYMDKVGK